MLIIGNFQGRGLQFSASWNILRLGRIADARRAVEFNRTLGLYRPINIASLVLTAAYEKLDELDSLETQRDRQPVLEFLNKALPVLKVQVLEELLGEHLNLSGVLVLAY